MNRVLLVEKNIFMREALRQFLAGRFPSLIVEEAVIHDCLDPPPGFRPDIMILGLGGFDGSAMKSLREMREKYPATVIVLFIEYETDEYRKNAFMNGADHIISKDMWSGKEILALLEKVLTGKKGTWGGIGPVVCQPPGFP